MDNVVEFPVHRTKNTKPPRDPMDEILTTEQAVNELTHCMLTEVVKLYIDNRWSFAELDLIVSEFRGIMTMTAPERISRRNVQEMNDGLRPLWTSIVESIRSSHT